MSAFSQVINSVRSTKGRALEDKNASVQANYESKNNTKDSPFLNQNNTSPVSGSKKFQENFLNNSKYKFHLPGQKESSY